MYLEHLSLRNFRNYRALELDLPPGPVAFVGDNAQGKSNLLEAVYLLSVMKSVRASQERQVINLEALREGEVARVGGAVRLDDGTPLRVEVALRWTPPAVQGAEGPGLVKRVRLNGAPRPASEAVGRFLAVLFSASDLEIVLGPPQARRRFLDILLSLVDRAYLRALQRYQRVLLQRNHLLRLLAAGRAAPEEMGYWDLEMAGTASAILGRRLEALSRLAPLASDLYRQMSGGREGLELRYRSTVPLPPEGNATALRQAVLEALARSRERELAQGATVVGPHRDDLELLVDGASAGLYGSRGQARTIALALRLGEARFLAQERGERPVLLLDDVFSELDQAHRRQVVEAVAGAEQALITTLEAGEALRLRPSAGFRVVAGRVGPLEGGGATPP